MSKMLWNKNVKQIDQNVNINKLSKCYLQSAFSPWAPWEHVKELLVPKHRQSVIDILWHPMVKIPIIKINLILMSFFLIITSIYFFQFLFQFTFIGLRECQFIILYSSPSVRPKRELSSHCKSIARKVETRCASISKGWHSCWWKIQNILFK